MTAPIAPIDYQVEIADLHAHQFRVTLTLPQPSAQQRLSLPVWIPGSYLVREFSRHLSGLEARQGKRPVTLRQLDKCTWQAECRGSTPLVVSGLVYAYDASVRTAWLEASRGFFNGTSLFLRCEGHEARAHRVSLPSLPKGWQVATGMRAVGTARRPVFESADYDELIDHPFELGPFWRGTFEACGVPHEFVVAGAWPGFDGDRLIADAKRICEAQIRFWHGDEREDPQAGALRRPSPEGSASARGGPSPTPPFDRYVFLLNTVDDGYGGLEHRASTALICGRRDLPRKGQAGLTDGYVTLLGLISHEYFHTWNVKRLKPSEFAPYDLTRENTTELLWFFEGFTSYYDDLLLLRAGLIDEARYLKLVAKTVNQVLGTPGRRVQSVAEASFDAWIKYYRPDENSANATVSYYTKGSLVALALDLRLRAEGRGSLDAVLRRLWQRSQGGPIDEGAIAEALAFVGKRSYDDELQAWVHGTADLPLAELLAPLGVRWTRETPQLQHRLGARVAEAGLKVQAVLRGGAAEAAGLAAGDELVGVDDWRLGRLDDLLPLGAFDRPVTLLVARDRRLLRLPFQAAAVEGAVTLSADPKPGAAVLRRRAAWLKPVAPA